MIALAGLFLLLAHGAAAACAPRRGVQLFIDFDGTIVTSDAYTALATAAYATLPRDSPVLPWDEIEAVYGARADAAAAALPEPTSLAGAIARADDASLRAVEAWSFDWVRGMGLFATASAAELTRAARNQTLRAGWCAFARTAQGSGLRIHVVSLNWSPSWIRLVLREAAGCPDVAARVAAYSPEILPRGVLPASPLSRAAPLFSGGDKTALVESLLEHIPEADRRKVVFVSDGKADLRPLWDAPTNVGIVAGHGGSAARTFRQYGVGIWEAREGWKGFTGEKTNAVYGFEDWNDVAALLWQ
ncbi:hypothetical protein F4802DRAFT_620257 [Xylaria palmicola]|nr:hypothetical protein F4802DRAFT_620257 [Xylaria palmicola]